MCKKKTIFYKDKIKSHSALASTKPTNSSRENAARILQRQHSSIMSLLRIGDYRPTSNRIGCEWNFVQLSHNEHTNQEETSVLDDLPASWICPQTLHHANSTLIT